MKKLAIDATWYFDGNPSGRIVVKNIVDQFLNRYNKEIFLIFKLKDKSKALNTFNDGKIKLLFVPNLPTLFTNIFIIPLVLLSKGIKFYICQYFTPPIKKIKSIVYIHDVIFERNPFFFTFIERLYFKAIKPLSLFAYKIITVSNYEKKQLIKYGYGSEKIIEVIYNGINFNNNCFLNNKEQLKKFNIGSDYLLYVGRLNKRKNIENLISAYEKLNYNLDLVLVGKKDYGYGAIEKMILKSPKKGRILVLGYITDSELDLLYKNCLVFCFVSYDEGFGLPPIEAISYNKLSVISNSGSLPEICGENAIYINPYSVKDIVNGIELAIKKTYDNDVNIDVDSIRKKYTWHNVYNRLISFLDD